jgi:L-erythro-3,5-diaminohexanoate dehydrogenase
VERFGTHRSIDPPGVLPQQARVLDASPSLSAEEIGIDVEYLNVDSASWHQIRTECDGEPTAMKDRLMSIVRQAGKLHNPVTGSGGMLVGTVRELGAHRVEPEVGARIATLVSLTLTPLSLDEILELDPQSEKVRVKGTAVLFGAGIYTPVPDDLDDEVVLGVLDVCGAPAWAARLVRPGMRVVVIGAGGKSGSLVCAQSVKSTGEKGRVLGLCWPADTTAAAEDAGAEAVAVDCTDAVAVHETVAETFEGRFADVVFVCANVEGCEGGAILAADDGGRVVFFSMSTSFTSAALTAEGVGKSCQMIIGNGYVPGHAQLALDLVRRDPRLRERLRR